jgi:ribosome biogenesis protein MAK21
MAGENTKVKAPRRRGKKASKDGYQKSEELIHDVATYKPHKTLLIHLTESTPTWWECGRGTASRDDTITSISKGSSKKIQTNSLAVVSKYRNLADSIYRQEVNLFRTAAESNKDEQWVENTMKRGTLKDRIAAMSVVVGTNPVHKLYALDMLLNLAGVSADGGHSSQTNERVASMAAEALTDLFTTQLLPTHRKLIGLESRPLYLYEENRGNTKRNISPRILLLWRYEEIMKNKYASFITGYLGKTLSQNVTAEESKTKINALRTACSLLKGIPEGEQTLLSLIVNKVGDPSKKIAAAAGHELRRILETHPAMTKIIAREVSTVTVIFVVYHLAWKFFTFEIHKQVQQLAHRPNLSTRALYNCIIFLNQLKLKKEETNGQKVEDKGKMKEVSLPASLINTYFRIFEVAVNKSKPKESKDKSNIQSDAAMKSRLLGALLTGVNRAHPYLPSKDTGMEQHIDSLYRIAHVSPPSACTQALMLLFHLAVGTSDDEELVSKSDGDFKSNEARKDRFYRALYSKLSDPHMLFGKQLTLFFNLVYKAMKNDSDPKRIVAFGKRLLHVSFHYNPAVTSGALFLISEVMKKHPSLTNSAISADGHCVKFDPLKRDPRSAFIFHSEGIDNDDSDKLLDMTSSDGTGSLWEISLTMQHYHPSVCKFSQSLGDIVYNGDPLRDFSLAPFLDKFAFRNPKSMEKIKEKRNKGEGVGQRRSGLQGEISAMSSLPVNDPDFWKKQKSISEQEEFFHKFFVERAKRDELKGISRGKKDEDVVDAAFNAAEAKADHVTFDWDSDEEEEEFVQNLAESLMRSRGEKINFDDEDPDMDDWSGYSSNDGGEDKDKPEFSALDGDLHGFDDVSIDSDVSIESDNDDEVEAKDTQVDDDAEDGAMVHSGSESDDDSEADSFALDLADDSEEDDEGSDGDNDDDVDDSSNKKTSNKQPKSAFADAEEYEEIMYAAWEDERNNKRPNSDVVEKSGKKNKKRRKASK